MSIASASSQTAIEPNTFIERFRPVVNPIDSAAAFDFGCGGCLFETYGEELAFVRAQDPACVWTLCDSDGELYAISGARFVNRIGYFVCENPAPVDHRFTVSFRNEATAGEVTP